MPSADFDKLVGRMAAVEFEPLESIDSGWIALLQASGTCEPESADSRWEGELLEGINALQAMGKVLAELFPPGTWDDEEFAEEFEPVATIVSLWYGDRADRRGRGPVGIAPLHRAVLLRLKAFVPRADSHAATPSPCIVATCEARTAALIA